MVLIREVHIHLDDDDLEYIGTFSAVEGCEKALKDFAQKLCDQRNSIKGDNHND